MADPAKLILLKSVQAALADEIDETATPTEKFFKRVWRGLLPSQPESPSALIHVAQFTEEQQPSVGLVKVSLTLQIFLLFANGGRDADELSDMVERGVAKAQHAMEIVLPEKLATAALGSRRFPSHVTPQGGAVDVLEELLAYSDVGLEYLIEYARRKGG